MSDKKAGRNQKQLLDELFGNNRNVATYRRHSGNRVDWRDENICINHLCGWCPFRAFDDTKAAIGKCTKQHNEVAKTIFERQPWEKQFNTYVAYRATLNLVKREYDFRTRRSKDKMLQMLQNKEETTYNAALVGRKEMDAMKDIDIQIKLRKSKIKENAESKKKPKWKEQISVLETVLEQLQKKLYKVMNINDPSRYLLCETCGGLISNIHAKGGNEMAMHDEGIIHMETIKYHSEMQRVDQLFIEKENISKEDKIALSDRSVSSSRSSRSRSYSDSYSRSTSGSRSRSPTPPQALRKNKQL